MKLMIVKSALMPITQIQVKDEKKKATGKVLILFRKCYLYCSHNIYIIIDFVGARGVVVIVVENGHDDTSSNPGRD